LAISHATASYVDAIGTLGWALGLALRLDHVACQDYSKSSTREMAIVISFAQASAIGGTPDCQLSK
jgi:hypothetical protein